MSVKNTKKEGPSRHPRTSAYNGHWSGEWTDDEIRALVGGEDGERKEAEPPAEEEARIRGRDDLEQELAMLLGGRRLGYAASQLERDNPYATAARESHAGYVGGHGDRTYSEQFTEPDDETAAANAEERALIRERDRLDPNGKPTRKMQLQEAAKQKIIDEWKRRGGR